jgi:hypothetical protein
VQSFRRIWQTTVKGRKGSPQHTHPLSHISHHLTCPLSVERPSARPFDRFHLSHGCLLCGPHPSHLSSHCVGTDRRGGRTFAVASAIDVVLARGGVRSFRARGCALLCWSVRFRFVRVKRARSLFVLLTLLRSAKRGAKNWSEWIERCNMTAKRREEGEHRARHKQQSYGDRVTVEKGHYKRRGRGEERRAHMTAHDRARSGGGGRGGGAGSGSGSGHSMVTPVSGHRNAT